MLNKNYYKVVKMFEYFPEVEYIELSANRESEFEYNFTSYYSAWITIKFNNQTEQKSIWGYVGTKDSKYICVRICENEFNFSEEVTKEILSLSLNILYNIETELQYGITLRKLIRDSGYRSERLDYQIERTETRHVSNWASNYFYREDDEDSEIED